MMLAATTEALTAAGAVVWEVPTLPYLEKLRRSAATPDDLSPIAKAEESPRSDNSEQAGDAEEDDVAPHAHAHTHTHTHALLDVTPATPAVFVSQSTPAALKELPRPTPVSCNRSFATVGRGFRGVCADDGSVQAQDEEQEEDEEEEEAKAPGLDTMAGTLLLPVSASAGREALVERVSHLRTALQQSMFETQQLQKLVGEVSEKQGHMAAVNNDLYLHVRELREQVASLLAAQASGTLPRTEDGFVSVQQQEAMGMSLRQLRGDALDTANRELYKLKTALVDKDARISALRLQVRLRDINTNAQHASLEAECERLRGEVARLSILRAGKAQEHENAARALERDERLRKTEGQLAEATSYIETLKATLCEVRDKTMERCAQLAEALDAERRRAAELEQQNAALQVETAQPSARAEPLSRPEQDHDDEVRVLRAENDTLRERVRALEDEMETTQQLNEDLHTLMDETVPTEDGGETARTEMEAETEKTPLPAPVAAKEAQAAAAEEEKEPRGVSRVLWEEAVRECGNLRRVNERLVTRLEAVRVEQPPGRVSVETASRAVQASQRHPSATLSVQPTSHVTVTPAAEEQTQAPALQAQLRLLHQHIDQLEADRAMAMARTAAEHERRGQEGHPEEEEEEEEHADIKRAMESSTQAVVESQRQTIKRLKEEIRTLSTGDSELTEAFLIQKRILRTALQQLDAERKSVESLRRSGPACALPPIEALSPEQTRMLVQQHVRMSVQRQRSSDELEEEDYVTFTHGEDDDEEEDDDVVLPFFARPSSRYA